MGSLTKQARNLSDGDAVHNVRRILRNKDHAGILIKKHIFRMQDNNKPKIYRKTHRIDQAILLIVAKSSKYSASGRLFKISSGSVAITRCTHAGSSMPADPFRQLRTVFLRCMNRPRTTSAYRFRSSIKKMGSRGKIFTTVECTWGRGEKHCGGSSKHRCTAA